MLTCTLLYIELIHIPKLTMYNKIWSYYTLRNTTHSIFNKNLNSESNSFKNFYMIN